MYTILPYRTFSIGILALLALFSDNQPYSGFIIAYAAYCTYKMNCFYGRRIAGRLVLFRFVRKNHAPNIETQQKDAPLLTELPPEAQALQTALEQWVTEKKFCQKDLSVEQVAEMLGTNLNFLRYYFRTYMQTEFRTWRIELRIGEAQRLMKEYPNLSLPQICEMAGFNDCGNFHRLFRRSTGMTPINYKHSCTCLQE